MTFRYELVERAGGSHADHKGPGTGADVAYRRRSLLSGVRHQDRSGKVLLVNSGDDSTGAGACVEVVNPWEERKDRGRVSALVAALVLLATAPRKFFEGTRPDAGIWSPLLFVGLVTIIGTLLNTVILTILTFALPEPAVDLLYRMEISTDSSQLADSEELPFGPTLSALIIIQVLLLFLPVIFALTLFFMLVFGGLVHLLLMVTRTPRRHGFRGTWAVLCYANGAFLLSVVPFAGDIVSIVCTAALFGFGLRVVQGVGLIRAVVLSSILPLLALLALLARLRMEAIV